MIAISLIMPTVDWGPTFSLCLQAAQAGLGADDELLAVFDGVSPPPPDWLNASGVVLLQTGVRSGPAFARNLGAEHARNPILLFVDADVEIHSDAIDRIRVHFSTDKDLAALFGSYDDCPAAPGLVSRFRNLLHHYTHTSQPGPACTFWAGCGAVRRDRFLASGGFDAKAYSFPSIEDIEFGLRLHADGGKILLDPTIQGTHYKRWTLRLMVFTDVQRRAIPWSLLLLSRRQIPATLNLSTSARISAGLSLVIIFALSAVFIPKLWLFALATQSLAIAGLLVLNRSLIRLLLDRGGVKMSIAGCGLLVLYYAYSSLTFTGVVLISIGQWLAKDRISLAFKANAFKYLPKVLICILMLASMYGILRGSSALFLQSDNSNSLNDLLARYDEWKLFRQGIYPAEGLADIQAMSLPYFRTTVYLPWALPLFAFLFFPGGLVQGKLLIWVGSMLSLILISVTCRDCLRRWGREAGLIGALSPLAFANNNLCLSVSQFTIVCMGLVTLQWLSIRNNRPITAGILWSMAMIKPQIAVVFATPLVIRSRLFGLTIGVCLLIALSALALAITSTSPVAVISVWLSTLPKFVGPEFVGGGTRNVMLSLVSTISQISIHHLSLLIITASSAALVLANRLVAQVELSVDGDLWDLAGFCAIVGYISLYTRIYDHIMLFPALLACLRAAYKHPNLLTTMVCIAMASTVWLPQRLWNLIPHSETLVTFIFISAAVLLLYRVCSICKTSTSLTSSV